MDEEPVMPVDIHAMEKVLERQSQAISTYAEQISIEISNDSEYEAAMVEVIHVREKRKWQEKFFKDLMEPLTQAVANMKIKIAEALAPIKTKEDLLTMGITSYATKKEAEAEAAKRAAELEHAQALADAQTANEPVLLDDLPAPLHLPTQPASVKTGTHVGGVVNIPKWKFEHYEEINSDEDSDIYADDPRAKGVDPMLFKLDRGRVSAWNKSKVPMKGIVRFYGKTVAVGKRRS